MNNDNRQAFIPRKFVYESGAEVEEIPDGIVVASRVETLVVFCAADMGRTSGQGCCAEWGFKQNLCEPPKTISEVETLLLDDGWKKRDSRWICPECSAKRRRGV